MAENRGDEYTYCPPDEDRFVQFVRWPTEPHQIRIIEAGPARETLEVRLIGQLPKGLTEDRKGRSEELVDCEIVSRVSLYPGVARIDIETEIDNQREGPPPARALPDRHPRRPLARRAALRCRLAPHRRAASTTTRGFETPVATYPQKSFVDISDGERGFMLANRGLPEYEAIEEADGTITIALTLLRCVEWLSRDDLSTRKGHAGPGMHTPGAQMQGRWKFQYSIDSARGRVGECGSRRRIGSCVRCGRSGRRGAMGRCRRAGRWSRSSRRGDPVGAEAGGGGGWAWS